MFSSKKKYFCLDFSIENLLSNITQLTDMKDNKDMKIIKGGFVENLASKAFFKFKYQYRKSKKKDQKDLKREL